MEIRAHVSSQALILLPPGVLRLSKETVELDSALVICRLDREIMIVIFNSILVLSFVLLESGLNYEGIIQDLIN